MGLIFATFRQSVIIKMRYVYLSPFPNNKTMIYVWNSVGGFSGLSLFILLHMPSFHTNIRCRFSVLSLFSIDKTCVCVCLNICICFCERMAFSTRIAFVRSGILSWFLPQNTLMFEQNHSNHFWASSHSKYPFTHSLFGVCSISSAH